MLAINCEPTQRKSVLPVLEAMGAASSSRSAFSLALPRLIGENRLQAAERRPLMFHIVLVRNRHAPDADSFAAV